jgi:1-acyl-sn-glycerol-3-phosphate acyltransferase
MTSGGHRSGSVLRAQFNRLVALVILPIALPLIVLAEAVHRGSGRAVAVRSVRLIARLCGVRFQVVDHREGAGGGPAVFTPNHSSPMDIPAMLAACPDVRFVAAAELFRIPLLASAMRALHTLPIERRQPEVARRQLTGLVELIQRRAGGDRTHLAIFPQGGIAGPGRWLPFKSGAFSLAIQTGTPVVPVAIHGADAILPPRRFLAIRPGVVVIELLPPLETRGMTMDDHRELRDRVETSIGRALRSPWPQGGRPAAGRLRLR